MCEYEGVGGPEEREVKMKEEINTPTNQDNLPDLL
jgi:hypothetical protein